LRKKIDRLGTVLPFEPEFFDQRGFSVFAMGHPLMEDYGVEKEFQANLQAREQRLEGNHQQLTIGILPGSRRQEIVHLLSILKITGQAVTGHLSGTKVRLVVSAAPGLDTGFIQGLFGSEAEVTTEPLATLLPRIDLALVCSGTASLEATLAGVPHEVVYRTGAVNFWLAKRLVKTEFIGLSNLILDKPVVREHLQGQVAPLPLARSLLRWLARPPERKAFYEDVRQIRSLCGEPGVWERTAVDVLAQLAPSGSALGEA
jgi:lipid-A-disaccharide synthase